jgi:hypothetical protein
MIAAPSKMISLESWPWGKSLVPAFRILRSVLAVLLRRRSNLVFVQRPFSGWNFSQPGEKSIVNLRSELTVTNPNDHDGVVVVRVQIGRAGFARRRALQDCHWCDIAGERVSTLSAGVLIAPRTTATMQITHPFEVDQLPDERVRTLSFRVIVTDQLNRCHTRRIKLQRFPEGRSPNPIVVPRA